MKIIKLANRIRKKWICYENGRLYFTKDLERTVFFVLTVCILAYGVLVKIGWL